MFSVTKALKKLIECSIGDGKKHCNGYVTFSELNAIFEAGQEEGVDEKLVKRNAFYMTMRANIKELEERLARLEEVLRKEAWNHVKPSKPTEPMAHYSEHGVEIGKPDEKCKCFSKYAPELECICDKTSEFITPHKCVSDGAVYMSNPPQNRCKICGKFWYV